MLQIKGAFDIYLLSSKQFNACRQVNIFNASAFQKNPLTFFRKPFDKPIWPGRGFHSLWPGQIIWSDNSHRIKCELLLPLDRENTHWRSLPGIHGLSPRRPYRPTERNGPELSHEIAGTIHECPIGNEIAV